MQEFWCHFQSQLQLATVVGVTSIWIILRTIISLFARPLSSRGCLPQLTLKVRSRFFLLALCPTSTAVANSLHSSLWFPVPAGKPQLKLPLQAGFPVPRRSSQACCWGLAAARRESFCRAPPVRSSSMIRTSMISISGILLVTRETEQENV